MHTSQPNNPTIRIRGFGLVSPFGIGAWPTFAALLQGKTLTDRIDPHQDYPDNVALIRALGAVGVAQHTRTDPIIELAERAAREPSPPTPPPTSPSTSPPTPPPTSPTFSHPSPHTFSPGMADGPATDSPIPLIIGTSKGAITALARATHNHLQHGAISPDDAQIFAMGPHGYLTHHLVRRLHGNYMAEHHVAACASGLAALHRANQLLRHTDHTRALVVAADAPLSPLLIHSYDRLGVLTPTQTQNIHDYAARPLDQTRHGFMLSELAAAVLLEKVPTSHNSPDGPGTDSGAGHDDDLLLLDTAVAGDPYDLIRPSPTMPTLDRMVQQLCADRAIDLWHPHAPGTRDHDPVELAIYEKCQPIRDAYAFKGALGHGLGAAGLVAFVIACLCHRTQKRPPMPWLNDSIHPAITREFVPHPIRTQAVFAAGFAGHVAGAVIGSASDRP